MLYFKATAGNDPKTAPTKVNNAKEHPTATASVISVA
jgi:hypothetical protein